MKSIKPGRGPSMMGGIVGIGMAAFGVFWTIMALRIGAPWMFAGFGVIFIVIAVSNAVYNFMNATGKKRFSEYDITSDEEESDPLNELFGERTEESENAGNREAYAFCPYCGEQLDKGDKYCSECGKRIQ